MPLMGSTIICRQHDEGPGVLEIPAFRASISVPVRPRSLSDKGFGGNRCGHAWHGDDGIEPVSEVRTGSVALPYNVAEAARCPPADAPMIPIRPGLYPIPRHVCVPGGWLARHPTGNLIACRHAVLQYRIRDAQRRTRPHVIALRGSCARRGVSAARAHNDSHTVGLCQTVNGYGRIGHVINAAAAFKSSCSPVSPFVGELRRATTAVRRTLRTTSLRQTEG